MTDDTDDGTNDRTDDESPDSSAPRSDPTHSPGTSGTDDNQSSSPPSRRAGSTRRGRNTTVGSSTDRSPIEYVYWGGLVICSILAVVALFNFYSNATQAISMWVEAKYEPIIQSAFALVVLLAALVGVSLTVRELSPSGPK